MKRLFLLSVFLICLAFPALAQVKVGVKAGLTYSNADFPNLQYYKKRESKTGYHWALFTKFPISKRLYIKQELGYNRKGWFYTNSTTEEKLDLHYLGHSILLGIKLPYKFSLLVGPEVSFLAKLWINESSQTMPTTDGLDLMHYNRLEAGLSGGITHQVLEKLTIEARYSLGLTDLLNGNLYSNPYDYTGGRNKAFQFSVNYIFSKNETKDAML